MTRKPRRTSARLAVEQSHAGAAVAGLYHKTVKRYVEAAGGRARRAGAAPLARD
jgi:hypothetical protein